tara:strand:+ start:181 stop:399 length:219 start_codon:yes stop_codon:yes gene_type:complete
MKMWKLFKEDNGYIQGRLISQHTTEKAALKKAEKEINFSYKSKVKRNGETLIWLENRHHIPVGIIVRKENKK